MLTDDERKYILNEHLRNIHHISDKKYQRKTWICGEGPDFDEACCHFFDDGDPILEHYHDFEISESQYQLLKEFRDDFELFSDKNYWPPEFIDTPEWNTITEKAKEVLNSFNYRNSGN